MKINVKYYPFGHVIKVRKKTTLEVALSQQNIILQEFYKIVRKS